ncbi:hypothetical protein HYG77_04920 [Rhodococcus sp. ZPP]|uniref:hypothetical protein n=1 Tax=Rhodococcus sp. ZPP TaxID=2749906 RepID=UPI001AD882FE|nr:hypothetical protein [Rhodococcus sp. ZPP]QTJ65006.1 hypothetical protein HYG77_04920 [Rhodococcus sp. ZPP]
MKLRVADLITTAEQGIERAKLQQIEWDTNVDAAEQEWERRWKEEIVPNWRPFRDHLTLALKKGLPITKDQLPVTFDRYNDEKATGFYRPFNRGRRRHGYGNEWQADHEFGQRPVLKITAFETLIDFLGTVDDETVTTAQLERVGFRSLNKLFEAAANGYWE